MRRPFRDDTGTIPIETVAPGTLMMPDGRPVYAYSSYATAPSDGRPLRNATTVAPTDSTARIAASSYAQGTLMTSDGRPVYALLVTP